jgi:YidC/Oxa1 family membrane protein insertase
MNKNTILAVILSFLVLLTYKSFFVPPEIKQLPVSTNATRTANISVTQIPSAVKSDTQATMPSFPEKKWDLQTPHMKAFVTNVGGALNVDNEGMQLVNLAGLQDLSTKEFQLISAEPNKVILNYTDKDVQITKTVETKNDLISVRMEINSKEISRLENTNFILLQIDSSKIDMQTHQRDVMLDEYSTFSSHKVTRQNNAYKFNIKQNKDLPSVEWAGFRDHYRAIVVRPEFETKTVSIKSLTEKELRISTQANTAANPNKGQIYEFSIYAGPQDIVSMKKYGKNFEHIVAFFNWGLLNVFAKGIYYTIAFLHKVIPSWGMNIILISLLIYGLTYPLTFKSMMSMRKMQQMQPKIKALQERYKGDPQKLQTEMMEIYRREKINPLAGCLPMLLQMPIFIALYQVLWRAFYFQGKGFLWIKDLSQPDRLFKLPFSLPFFNTHDFNILPLLMAGVMFAQQKLSAKSMVVSDEQQAMQQKMMMYFFPIFIGCIFYNFASGLSLYFTVFYLLSTLTQWKMSKIK